MASYTEISEANISYYDGNVYLKTDINPAVVEINYNGSIYAESQLPSGFLISEGSNKIIIVRLTNNVMPELLFTYNGEFKITIAKVYAVDGVNKVASISKLRHTFRETTDTWSQLNSNWSYYATKDYASSSQKPSLGGTIIINNELHTRDMGGLHLPNGDKDDGYFNFDSSGIFKTGKSRGSDSLLLKGKKKKFKRRKLSAKQIGRRNNG